MEKEKEEEEEEEEEEEVEKEKEVFPGVWLGRSGARVVEGCGVVCESGGGLAGS